MNKRDYLDLLRYYLRDLPPVVIEDIVYDYEEHFRAGLEKGKTEEQMADELGSPEDIAREYLGSDVYKKRRKYTEEAEIESSTIDYGKWILIALGIIILGPFILGIVGAAFGLFMGILGGLFGGGIGLIGGAIGLFFSIFTNGSSGSFINGIFINPITKILGTIFMSALGLMLLGLGVKFIKFTYKTILDIYVSIRWKLGR